MGYPVAWLVHEFNARVASHVDAPDPHDRRLGPDQFVVSLRHYKPTEGELSRERLRAALSTAEGLLLPPRGEGELIELSDDEAVAAAVMLPMVAADRLAPSASSHTGGAFKRNAQRDRLSEASASRVSAPSRADHQQGGLLSGRKLRNGATMRPFMLLPIEGLTWNRRSEERPELALREEKPSDECTPGGMPFP